MNKCKNCGSKLVNVGMHDECQDYRKWICPKCDLKDDQWIHGKNKDGEYWVRGPSGYKLHEDLRKQDEFFQKKLKPSMHYDKEYDMLYIAFNGGRKVMCTTETHTMDGRIIRFDFDSKYNIVGVEVEDIMKDDK